ncbi:hypothetical protein, partial [Pantoea agglomerans]|uniref:hypothetical protein n=1 Tax=Enterobacter agglomerans TaxID=549 RepID=UPI001A923BBD
NFISYERLRLSECMHLHWERMSASAGSVICNSIDVRFERKADVVRFGTELNLLTALWACQISPVFNC